MLPIDCVSEIAEAKGFCETTVQSMVVSLGGSGKDERERSLVDESNALQIFGHVVAVCCRVCIVVSLRHPGAHLSQRLET